MNSQTIEMLEGMENADYRNIKALVNYNLNSKRENKETHEDVRQEFLLGKANKSSFSEFMMRTVDQKNRYGNMMQEK